MTDSQKELVMRSGGEGLTNFFFSSYYKGIDLVTILFFFYQTISESKVEI